MLRSHPLRAGLLILTGALLLAMSSCGGNSRVVAQAERTPPHSPGGGSGAPRCLPDQRVDCHHGRLH